MRDSRGFTLMELMVGMLILSAAIAGALSFFIFQSQRGHESFRDKNTDEMVFSALALISRDVHAAGFGSVVAYPKLALLIKRTTGYPDELYTSFSDYVDTQYYERNPDLAAITRALRANSIFCSDGNCAASGVQYQGYLKLTDTSNLRLYSIPQRNASLNSAVGAILGDTDSVSTSDAAACDVNVKTTTAVSPVSGVTGTQDWTFPVVGATTAGFTSTTIVVPAVSYKVRYYKSDGSLYTGTPPSDLYESSTGTIFGSLWRNRGPDNNAFGIPLLGWCPNGGNPFINVKNFKIRRQYADGGWDQVDPSKPGEVAAVSPSPKNVRLLEITVTYQTNISKETTQLTGSSDRPRAVWSQPVTRVIRVSPRHLALLNS